MALSKKPKKEQSNKPSSVKSEAQIQAIISKGGSVAKENTSLAKAQKLRLQLRLLPNQVALIDAILSKSMFKKSRHSWILEAIEEKIQRETTD